MAGDLIRAPSFNEYYQSKEIQNETDLGPWTWHNGITQGYGGFFNSSWWRKKQSGSYLLGIEIMGSYLNGSYTTKSDHRWSVAEIGLAPGLRINGSYFDGADKKNRPYQWEFKMPIRYESLSIHDYEREQRNILGGLSAKYSRQISDKLDLLVTGEWRYGIKKDLESSLFDDTVDSRTHFFLGVYGKYKIDRDWSIIAGGGPFHRGWDDSWGIKTDIGVQYKKISITLGSLYYPFGLVGDYQKIKADAGDLFTLIGIIKINFVF
jgi:hypothetical protein